MVILPADLADRDRHVYLRRLQSRLRRRAWLRRRAVPFALFVTTIALLVLAAWLQAGGAR